MSTQSTRPTTRREYGSGSAQETPPGSGIWRLRVYVGRTEDGQPRQVSRTFRAPKRGGKKEVMAALRKLQDEVRRGEHGGPDGTVDQLLAGYIETRKREWAPRTLIVAEALAERVRAAPLGKIKLSALTTRHLESFCCSAP